MKHSLAELKKMVLEHKKSIPMLSAGKGSLMAYAIKHKLIDAEMHIHKEEMHETESKKERDMAHKDVHSALEDLGKKYPKNKKVMKIPEMIPSVDHTKEPKKKMVHDLKEVQRLKKEINVSLKEAWHMYLSSKKKE